jgi:hypothetical protein
LRDISEKASIRFIGFESIPNDIPLIAIVPGSDEDDHKALAILPNSRCTERSPLNKAFPAVSK